jgi:hypothetical protein
MSLLLRVRTQLGTWRIKDVQPSDSISVIRRRIEMEHHTDLRGRAITSDIEGRNPIADRMTVAQAGLTNGSMIYAMVDEEKTGVHEAAAASNKRITKDGNIIAQDFQAVSNSQGFRPGMLPLRSIKKQWTLSDYIQLDEQFVFRIGAPKPAYCKLANAGTLIHRSYMQISDLFGVQQTPKVWKTSSDLFEVLIFGECGWDTFMALSTRPQKVQISISSTSRHRNAQAVRSSCLKTPIRYTLHLACLRYEITYIA